jgi:hypothetical protein
MYVKRTTEARSCNHFCSGKAIYITYSQFVSVALGILHSIRMRYNIFPHYLINGTIFERTVIEYKMCFDFLYISCLKRFSF